jgi:hypothetical protein
MTTCTAPDHPTSEIRYGTHDACDSYPWTGALAERLEVRLFSCSAPAPQSCEGTEWPPATSWQRYGEDRASGSRIPPSVSTWREQDRRRQAAAEREAREQAPAHAARAVAWGPAPACDDRKAAE